MFIYAPSRKDIYKQRELNKNSKTWQLNYYEQTEKYSNLYAMAASDAVWPKAVDKLKT